MDFIIYINNIKREIIWGIKKSRTLEQKDINLIHNLLNNMPTIFAKILNNEIPFYKIHENDNFLAFLDAFPIAKGHTLVIPKLAVDNFWDMNAEGLEKILKFAQPIAKAIEKYTACKKCALAVVGLEIAHAHLHLLPVNAVNELNFNQKKQQLSSTEMEQIQYELNKLILK